MTDHAVAEPDVDLPADLVRLRNTIAYELNAQLALRCETIELADVPGLADALASRIAGQFRVEERTAGHSDPLRAG